MILTIYYLLFAAILLFVELGIKGFRYEFFFLNFAFGKAMAAFFFAFSMIGGGDSWMQIPIGIFFFLTGILYSVMACYFREFEHERLVITVLEPMEKEQADKAREQAAQNRV